MMRRDTRHRWLTLCALLCMCCSLPAFAGADAVLPGATLLEIPDMEGVLRIGTILPLEDGSIVIGGQVQYPGEAREPYNAMYDSPYATVRNDAIMMKMDGAGRIRWHIMLGDPQASNFFSPRGCLPDGRILTSFAATDSTFGDRYFIMNLDGVAEEMLPWQTLATHFPPNSMTLLPDTGYLGSDSNLVDDYYDSHSGVMEDPARWHRREMTLLDFDLQEVWKIDLSPLGETPNLYAAEGISDGIILLGEEAIAVDGSDAYEWCTSVIKLDKATGDILWQLTDTPRVGWTGASDALELPDGDILFAGRYLAEGETVGEDEQLATLTKITPAGEVVWTRRYDDLGIYWMRDIVPLGDGYAMVGRTQSDAYGYIVLHVGEDGELLGTLTMEHEVDRMSTWASLTPAPDGTVYISGVLYRSLHPQNKEGRDVSGSFLGTLSVEDFVPVNGNDAA